MHALSIDTLRWVAMVGEFLAEAQSLTKFRGYMVGYHPVVDLAAADRSG